MRAKARRRRAVPVIASIAALALVLTACPAPDEEPVVDPDDLEGMTVTIMSPWADPEEEAGFLGSLEPWLEETGAEISHEGSGDMETLVVTRVEAGNPPDIAMVPQPGLVADLYELGEGLRDLSEVLDVDRFEAELIEGLFELGVVDDILVGALFRLSLKSMVWYPQDAFEAAGYEEPGTWDELLALTDQIRDDGIAPWCLGIESGGATGWVATDWFEDIMLRTAGPEAYDDWVAGDLPFSSPEVTRAAELFAEIAFTEGNVLETRAGIITVPFGESPNAMFEDPPACMLHRQASFITSFFPEDIRADLDGQVGWFPFPEIDPDFGTPALIAGDQAILFTDNPAAESLVRFMASAEGVEGWAAVGGTLSPYIDLDPAVLPTETDRLQQEFLAEASFARFDASDMMPGAVGAGSFWVEVSRWINGDVDLETALQNIDASWPS